MPAAVKSFARYRSLGKPTPSCQSRRTEGRHEGSTERFVVGSRLGPRGTRPGSALGERSTRRGPSPSRRGSVARVDPRGGPRSPRTGGPAPRLHQSSRARGDAGPERASGVRPAVAARRDPGAPRPRGGGAGGRRPGRPAGSPAPRARSGERTAATFPSAGARLPGGDRRPLEPDCPPRRGAGCAGGSVAGRDRGPAPPRPGFVPVSAALARDRRQRLHRPIPRSRRAPGRGEHPARRAGVVRGVPSPGLRSGVVGRGSGGGRRRRPRDRLLHRRPRGSHGRRARRANHGTGREAQLRPSTC